MAEQEQFALEDLEHPEQVLSALLSLSELRATYRLAKALDARYPTQEAWNALVSSRPVAEAFDELAGVIQDIQAQATELSPSLTPQRLREVVQSHYPRALDAVSEVAELVEVPGEDLLEFFLES